MKNAKSSLIVLLLLCGANLLFARIGISLTINRSLYMQYEHIYALVTLRNNSGRPLLFGTDPSLQGFLTLDVRDRSNRPVAKVSGQEISITGVMLAPGETRNVVLPIDRYYQLQKPDRYRVTANISHNALGGEYRSKAQYFRISQGVEMWKRTVGLPDITGKAKAGDLIPERTYSIHALSDNQRTCYYLKVSDRKYIYGVCLIGEAFGYERYQVEVDMLSRIHLLMPVAPRIYHYLAFSFDGKNIANSYWKTTSSIPTLHRDRKTGIVSRLGGAQAKPGRDFAAKKSNSITISDILQNERRNSPKAPGYSGLVDLGKGAVPEFDKDEK
ncbi:MAG: hypothetical protein IKD22_06425 [Lentisphaeria bacterium]|nr:hypothetical protein [Lentisphaeria bacterium]